MKKRLKLYGETLIISFNREERELYGLKEGDVLDFDEMLFQVKKVKQK